MISPGYLDVMGIALHRGRRLSPALDPRITRPAPFW